MSAINDGGPAFPRFGMNSWEKPSTLEAGMSLRDWFAGQFLAGACAASDGTLAISTAADQFDIDAALRDHWSYAARAAYIAADAMLAERDRAVQP